MAERRHGEPAPKPESTISGEDWDGRNISGQIFTRVLFADVDLTEVTNDGATFSECTFRRVQFNVSMHRDAAFINCIFSNCSFFDTQFTECKFVGSMFERCTYDLMKVTGGNWSFVGLPGADLRKATFRDIRMLDADLTGARCQGASILDVDLTGASLHGANFSDCDLRGSELGSLDPENTVIKGAIITYEQALVIAVALGLDVRPG